MSMLSNLRSAFRDLSATYDGDPVLGLLQREGLYGLGGCEGCPCTDLAVHGISIEVRCHKAGSTIRIYGADKKSARLPVIAEEVRRQVNGFYAAPGDDDSYGATFRVMFEPDGLQ